MPNRWMSHLSKVWAVQKKKGKTYRETMTIAKKSYRKGSAAAADDEAPKKRRRRKKKAP